MPLGIWFFQSFHWHRYWDTDIDNYPSLYLATLTSRNPSHSQPQNQLSSNKEYQTTDNATLIDSQKSWLAWLARLHFCRFIRFKRFCRLWCKHSQRPKRKWAWQLGRQWLPLPSCHRLWGCCPMPWVVKYHCGIHCLYGNTARWWLGVWLTLQYRHLAIYARVGGTWHYNSSDGLPMSGKSTPAKRWQKWCPTYVPRYVHGDFRALYLGAFRRAYRLGNPRLFMGGNAARRWLGGWLLPRSRHLCQSKSFVHRRCNMLSKHVCNCYVVTAGTAWRVRCFQQAVLPMLICIWIRLQIHRVQGLLNILRVFDWGVVTPIA